MKIQTHENLFLQFGAWRISLIKMWIYKVNIMKRKKTVIATTLCHRRQHNKNVCLHPPSRSAMFLHHHIARLFKYSHHILIVHLSCFFLSNDTHKLLSISLFAINIILTAMVEYYNGIHNHAPARCHIKATKMKWKRQYFENIHRILIKVPFS